MPRAGKTSRREPTWHFSGTIMPTQSLRQPGAVPVSRIVAAPLAR